MAMDLLLKALCQSPDFDAREEKNWSGIARLIPGTTARECQKRYEELWTEINLKKSTKSGNSLLSNQALQFDNSSIKSSRPSTSRSKELKSAKGKAAESIKNTDTGVPTGDHGPIMVIHVCDEAKNLKQDFTCPRDLLIREMKYFGEYLSTESQHLEEVDISVHCDVQVFDWLIKYVKRSSRDVPVQPQLEPSNVVSILISSDFLKMDALVQECIEFCHVNMNAILSTPCNMNCIDDRLVARISDVFNQNELEEIKDRKDKFKSKLFAKKVEKLFDSNYSSLWCPENASTLYRCSICKKVLTRNLESKVKCLQSRMMISRQGRLSYRHVSDATFDVNDYILDLKNQKSWGDVYWQLWGTINYLVCMRCNETFPCLELAGCRYHPESPVYEDASCGGQKLHGEYPCCNMKIIRFDPIQLNNGCRMRDHVVCTSSPDSVVDKTSSSFSSTIPIKNTNKQHVYDDLLAHRDAICLPYQKITSSSTDQSNVDIFGADEMACGLSEGSSVTGLMDSSLAIPDKKSEPHLKALMMERDVTYDDKFELSDDEVGDDEESKVTSAKKSRSRKSTLTIDSQAILLDGPDFNTMKIGKWDTTRSLRYNQDSQREEDQRRMREIIRYLTHLRLGGEKIDRLKQREYAGGIFSKLESHWKAVNIPAPRLTNPSFRIKPPRLNQLPITK